MNKVYQLLRFASVATIPLLGAVLALHPLAASGSIAVLPPDYTGFRSTANGTVTANGGWDGDENNGFQISWDISYNDGDVYPWSYSYAISGEGGSDLGKELSHFILQVSLDNEDLSAFDFPEGHAPDDGPKLFENGGSNPDLPNSIWGIKWETSSSTYARQLLSKREPVWGHFYAVDGKNPPTSAWNIGLDTPVLPNDETEVFTDWIPTPNGPPGGGEGEIPEPSSVVVWGLGLLVCVALGCSRRRRTRAA